MTGVAKMVGGHPLFSFVRLWSGAIAAVAWDTAAGVIDSALVPAG